MVWGFGEVVLIVIEIWMYVLVNVRCIVDWICYRVLKGGDGRGMGLYCDCVRFGMVVGSCWIFLLVEDDCWMWL